MTEKKRKPTKEELKEINYRGRTWLMTIFTRAEEPDKPTIERNQVEEAFKELDPDADWVYQLESGHKEHRLHFQLALCLSREKARRRKDIERVLEAHGIPDAHLEHKPREAAATYCSKTDTRVSGPWFSSEAFQREIQGGTLTKKGARTDLDAIHERLDLGATPDQLIMDGTISTPAQKTMAEAYVSARTVARWSTTQRDVRVHYLFGRTGTGKTRYIYDSFNPDSIYVANLGNRDPFESYNAQPILVLDEFRSQINISNMLQMLDRYPYQIDRRYHNVWAAWSQVFITSNWTLDKQYLRENSEDRQAFFRRITDVMAFPKQPVINRYYERDLFTGERITEPVISEVYSDSNDQIIREFNDEW